MLELNWSQLVQAWQERRKGVVFWNTAPLKTLEDSLHANDLAFVPHYSAPDQCTTLDVTFSDERSFASGACPKTTYSFERSASACKKSCA